MRFEVMLSAMLAAAVFSPGYEDGPRLAWDFRTAHKVSNGGYSRIKPIGNGKLALVYSDGPDVHLRMSADQGRTWGRQILVDHESGYDNTNAELLRLANGWLVYGWNGRPQPKTGLPYIIKIKVSKDSGSSWPESEERLIYTADTSYQNGCWEPAFLQLSTGELEIFFANENPFRTNADQEITMFRSKDNGSSWLGPVTTSHRMGARDGMAVPLRLQGGKGLVYSIEDNGLNGNFKPSIIWSSEQEAWSQGAVPGNSTRRWGALRSDASLSSSIYAGAPYITQMPGGETVLSVQSNERRTSPDAPMLHVYLGDAEAKNFAHGSTPFPWLAPQATALWNALAPKDSNTILATSSIDMKGAGESGIWTIEGTLVRAEAIQRWTPKSAFLDATVLGPTNIVLGSRSKTRMEVRTGWDDENLHLRFDVKDASLWGDSPKVAWDDDGVEVFLDPGNRNCRGVCSGMFKALVNIAGSRLYEQGSASGWTSWSPRIRTSIHTSGTVGDGTDIDSGYSISMSIPWADLGGRPAAGVGFGLHVKLHDDEDGGTAESHEDLSGADPNQASTWLRASLQNQAWTSTTKRSPGPQAIVPLGSHDPMGRVRLPSGRKLPMRASMR